MPFPRPRLGRRRLGGVRREGERPGDRPLGDQESGTHDISGLRGWTTLGMHLLHLVTGTAENGLMAAWVWAKGLDTKHARDIRVGCVYWYWIAAIWVPLYVLIYFGPRWI